MKRTLLGLMIAPLLLLGAPSAVQVAGAQPAAHPLNPPSERETRAARHSRGRGQIACTVAGCIRIPPECHPEMGYDLDDQPTGFDIVVCPDRR